ncbi:hypothetical protein TrVFT333_006482 [Trichoderma virens FT-333]|nr:hypothetical protein TrVFT333_006482 [Trichoderma virens FT-333]
MTFPVFQISLSGPANTNFNSFRSTDLESNDHFKITLANIRVKGRVPTKMFFTTGSKDMIDDSTLLVDYISLTKENYDSFSTAMSAVPQANGEPPLRKNKDLYPRPALLSGTRDFVNRWGDAKGIERGQLPSIPTEMRELSALKQNWAALSGVATDYGELTEEQWSGILSHNRALHGYRYDDNGSSLIKAPKAAFRIRPQILSDGNNEVSIRSRVFTQGNVFAATFTLGGYLHTGLSMSGEAASGGGNYAQVGSNTNEDGSSSLTRSLRWAWEARGGNTLLCSNPPAWAGTVSDYRLWRVMDQCVVVGMRHLIRDLDTSAYYNLVNPSADSDKGKDITKDQAFHDKVCNQLLAALQEPEHNRMVHIMSNHYSSDKFQRAKYLKFLEETENQELAILENTKWEALSLAQKSGVGLWMVHKEGLLLPQGTIKQPQSATASPADTSAQP